MRGQSFRPYSIQRRNNGVVERTIDSVAAEEPLQIYVRYWRKDAPLSTNLVTIMRTPGADRELAAGFILSEGIICDLTQLADLRVLGGDNSNEIEIELKPGVDFDEWKSARHTAVNASCGICGRHSIEAIDGRRLPRVDEMRLSFEALQQLPRLLREKQTGFDQTGGLHAAALIEDGQQVVSVFEDIGRHNALDKLIGSCLLEHRLPCLRHLVFMSSRSSFELVQKIITAGIPFLATVGAPSSLAIDTARAYGITLVGFVRDGRCNVYSGEWRIDS